MRSTSHRHLPRRILFILVAIVLAVGVYPAIRRGYAEWVYLGANDLSRVRTACELEPGDPECAWIRAEMTESESAELAAWEQAVRLNPRSPEVLSQAAIIREMDGDVPGAERLLLQAEEYNRLWLPRWSLASFYLRQNRPADTLKWARIALDRAYGDRRAGFRLCRQAGASDEDILNDILAADEPQNLAAFLSWIVEEGRLDALDQAVRKYLNAALHPRPAAELASNPAGVLSGIVETLLQHGHPAEAHDLWKLLLADRLLPVQEAIANEALTNPSFSLPVPNPPGFDWRTTSNEGIQVALGKTSEGIRFDFSGTQPEVAELLVQAVDLGVGRSWALDYEYWTRGISSADIGLQWALSPWGGSESIEEGSPVKSVSSDGWTRESTSWTIPDDSRFFRLALSVRRLPGHTRFEGELQLRKLHLSPAPSAKLATR